FAKNARSRDAKNRMYKGVNSSSLNAKGSGDKGIMAYNYRLCFTKSHRNKVRFRRPQNYSRSNYLLLLEDIGTREVKDINQILLFVEIPNKKFDINNRGPFSTNLVGGSWNYPESSWDERRIIEERHKRHIQGLLYFISNDRAVPLKIRQGLRRFGLCKDEFTDNDNWPSQIYVRSGRRLVGEYTMTQHDIQRARRHRDSIGLGSCPIEVHSVQRVETKERFVRNEGGVFEFVKRVFSVPYRSIIPKKSEASNLLVSVALSATHIAQSAIRMEPTYMIIGQSAGIAAAIAIRDNVAVQDIDYSKLKRRLIEVGQRL
ncbi:MAG: FAD-dependent oxidoreductase, partial [Deltaproteobacteria bacterium]|nr:FAD-dependent oxidoreductase [Deltaproteobacteria bacterium]